MKSEDHRDHFIDMLLWELVGHETPPDLRERVLAAIDRTPQPRRIPRRRMRLEPVRPRPRRTSRLPSLLAVAVVMLLAIGGGALYLREISADCTPVLTEVTGEVNRSAGALVPGESLSTGPLSGALITYRDGSTIELSSETTLEVIERSPWDRSREIRLASGRVDAVVTPRRKRAPMVFTSADARAEVVGTRLSFLVEEGRTRLEVAEGEVRFVSQSDETAPVLVKAGFFAAAGASGLESGMIDSQLSRGITRFTLMDAESDLPIREEALRDRETISLAALPTRKINIRAEFEGSPPASVRIRTIRQDGAETGLAASTSAVQHYPPFFVAGDHWADGRPSDCREWTPRPGIYHLVAEAVYSGDSDGDTPAPLSIELRFTE